MYLCVPVVVALLALSAEASLHNPTAGSLIGEAPLMDILVVLIMLAFLTTGLAYGRGARTITAVPQAMAAVTKTFSGLEGLIFLFLVIRQLLAHFSYTNLATVTAVHLADTVEHLNTGLLQLQIVFMAAKSTC